MLNAFCDWLSTTSMSTAFQTWSWFVPLVQTVHILSIAVLLMAVYGIGFRLLGLTRSPQSLATMSARLMPCIWAAFAVLLLTGLSLTITEPARELENSAFRVKMLMVLMLVGTIWLNHSRLNTDPDYWTVSGPRRRAARALGIASLGLGAGIVMAGRWIAYV